MSSPSSASRPLIDAPALHARLRDPDVLIVDVRHDLAQPDAGRAAFEAGHIPGAVFLHLDRDLSGPQRAPDGRFRGRHPLPDPRALAARLGAIGLRPQTLLVAYDEAEGMFAARLWWLARWLGHERVAVLDGGLDAWRAAGFELTTEPSHRAAAPAREPAAAMPTIDAEALRASLGSGRYRILDARAPERYRGEVEPLDAKAGHIPGARNRPYKLNLTPERRFKSPADLAREYAPLLADCGSDALVHQCGSGVSACHNVLAMAVAGYAPGPLYAGSWSEWSADPERPVATGFEP